MTDVSTDDTVRLPSKIDADIVLPDGSEIGKVRVVYRTDGMLQGIARGEVVLGPTVVVEPGVSREGATYVVPTPEGVYRLTRRSGGCGCGR